jgi:hypothetical protein
MLSCIPSSRFFRAYRLFPAILLLLLPASLTAALCPRPRPKANAEFFKVDSVFVGTVLSERIWGREEGWIYRLRVKRTFRGAARGIVAIYTEDNNAGLRLTTGEKYLLFARRDEGHLLIDGCGNSGLASNSEAAIQEIEFIPKAGPYGEIEGHIRENISGVRFVARCGSKHFSAITDEDGWFRMRVPAGKCELAPQSSNILLSPDDLSYDDPDHFIVHRGGSAQFEYVTLN